MTGKSILEALSFVDERYIEEAENEKVHARNPLRYLLPLAACFCLILAGLRFMPQPPETAEAPDTLVFQEPADESNLEIIVQDQENILREEMDISMDTQSIIEAPRIILRITSWDANGFVGIVEDPMYSESISLGESVQVELSPTMWTEIYEDGVTHGTQRVPTEADFPIGTSVMIQYATASDEKGVICAVVVSSDLDY